MHHPVAHHPPTHMPAHSSVHSSMFVYPSITLLSSTHPFICLPSNPSIQPPTHPFACIPTYSSFYPFAHPSTCHPPTHHPSIYLSLPPPHSQPSFLLCLPIYLSTQSMLYPPPSAQLPGRLIYPLHTLLSHPPPASMPPIYPLSHNILVNTFLYPPTNPAVCLTLYPSAHPHNPLPLSASICAPSPQACFPPVPTWPTSGPWACWVPRR